VSEARYFEKDSGGVVRHWQISRDGIRCRMAWGQVGGRTQRTSMTLDDETHARRHFNKKVTEKRRQGYVEVTSGAAAQAAAADVMAAAKLLDVMRVQEEKSTRAPGTSTGLAMSRSKGTKGIREVLRLPGRPGPFYDYLALSEDERQGLHFVVKKPGRDPGDIAAFLDFIRPRLVLAFDGRSHHKVPLPYLVGQFDHVLFCAPSLCGNRYGGRLGRAIPILDCEICDEDTETFVEARIQGATRCPATPGTVSPFP